MSKRKQTYELSTKTEMRKGTPDEYRALLQTAIDDTSTMVRAAVQDSQDPKVQKAFEKSAKIYVPKLYDILIKYDYTPKNARVVILDDCRKVKLWSKVYIVKFLPEETRDQSKRIGGKAAAKKREEGRQQELEQIREVVKPLLPKATEAELKLVKRIGVDKLKVGLANAEEETRQRVARSGGEAKYDQHPEDFSEMGKKGMDSRWHTAKVQIEDEEHRQIQAAYQESIMRRANGTGGYILFIRNGEFEKVEPNAGNAAKSINR